MEQYNREAAEYEDTYRQQMAQYEADLAARKAAEAERDRARDAAYAKAEENLLSSGLDFSVSARRSMDSNNSVGNEWYDDLRVNGQSIGYSGTTLRLKLGDSLQLSSKVVEDDSIPDVGTASDRIRLTDRDWFSKGFTFSHQVTVRENRGRYSGNTATFTITYTFEPQPCTVTIDESTLPAVPPAPSKPSYRPPKVEREAPSEAPAALVKPLRTDVHLPEPDYDALVPSRDDIFRVSPIARVLLLASDLLLFVVCLLSARQSLVFSREMKEEQRTQALMEQQRAEEMRLQEMRTDFFSTQGLSVRDPFRLPDQACTCEEEKRLNLRLLQMLRDRDDLNRLEQYLRFLDGKARHPYLDCDPEARAQLQELQALTRQQRDELDRRIDAGPDPLAELDQIAFHPLLTEAVAVLAPFFTRDAEDADLARFFRRSSQICCRRQGKSVLILTSCFLLQYSPASRCLTLLPFSRMRVRLKEGEAVRTGTVSPQEADILSTGWLHMTRTGEPDRRYRDNPVQTTVYLGTVCVSFFDVSLNLEFSKKADATRAVQNIRTYCSQWGEKNTAIAALLNRPCEETFSPAPCPLPAFPSAPDPAS